MNLQLVKPIVHVEEWYLKISFLQEQEVYLLSQKAMHSLWAMEILEILGLALGHQ